MQLFIVFTSFLIIVSAVPEEELWNEFKQKYLKIYRNLREERLRFQIFKSNLQIISEHNKRYEEGYESYTMKHNQFADLTAEEFKKTNIGYQHPDITTEQFQPPKNNPVPDSLDWRTKGAVLPVKNQHACSSCWAFSAVGALEGQNAIKHGIKVELSEQELVDCTRPLGNLGCKGGFPLLAYEYVKDNGISSDKMYPYVGKDNACSKASHARSSVNLTGYHGINANEHALRTAVASIGPISALISSQKIVFYDDGIFDDENCGYDLDHAVLIVGYGSEKGKDFWIVKNSWGTEWGDAGYIRMVRNKGNQCGIANQAFYPLIL